MFLFGRAAPSCTGPVANNGLGGKKEALALLERIVT
jgi:hypothetical protein